MWAARCRKANRLPAIDIFQTASALFYNACRQPLQVLKHPIDLGYNLFRFFYILNLYLRYV